MPPCFCSFNPPSTFVSMFISDHPFLSILEAKSCQTILDLKKIHAHLIKTGLARKTLASSRVLAVCATSPVRDMSYALSVFTRIEKPNVFVWNTIIRGFSQSSQPHLALQLFVEMLVWSPLSPDNLTYPSLFKAYSQLGLAKNGAQLHGRVIKLALDFDPFIRNSAIHMYANCGLLDSARKLFDEENGVDVVAWNSMIFGLSKCGEIGESWRLFCKMPCRNEVSWNTMISGFVRNGEWNEALELFHEMMVQEEKMRPSEFTLVSAMNACAKLGALEQGKWIHYYIEKNGIDLNVIVVTAIIDMYCKCGDIETARHVFEAAPRKGLSCWNSMMLGLATNGQEGDVFEFFLELEASNILRPDSVTFIAVLTAANHSVCVQKAKEYFKLMTETYMIEPTIEHYGCMVDVLGRAGLIEEATEVVIGMPMRPDAVIWGSLLSACIRHHNLDVAKWAAENLSMSDPNDTSAHILMSKAYALYGRYEEAMQERMKIKMKQMEKQLGCSLIELNGKVHEFAAAGKWHSQL